MSDAAKPIDVDAYIAGATTDARPVLEALRSLITSTVPGVDEGISWGVPFYRFHGALGGFAVYRKHVSFGLPVAIESAERAKLEAKGYATGKKTIQIRFDQKVPAATIKQILKAQARANRSRGG
jgi:uncharacterized protein YdhG (YjbR/CyaY superfamily)